MSAKQGGSFATLLLSIPLSAIPLMAIFGVPNFASLSASTEELIPDIVRQPVDDADTRSAESGSPMSFRSRAADLLASTSQTESVAPAATNAPRWDADPATTSVPTTPDNVVRHESIAGAEHQPSPRPMQTAAVIPSDDQHSTPAATESGLTWREAARKLEEVGITDFRLERGQSADRFLFFCRFSPGSDTRIIQRFEAEADAPLAAVEDVLSQVEAWLQHRYAQSRSWVQ